MLFENENLHYSIFKFLNEQYLEANVRRLNGVYDKILEFLDENAEFLKLVNEINMALSTKSDNNEEKHHKSKDNNFDFLINSIWTCVVTCLDLDLNVIFSPADPDLFHKNFTQTFEFLLAFESKCSTYDSNFKHNLLNSQSYKYFIKKWPIQVYFQIRFQEIVVKLEEDLVNYIDLNKQNDLTIDDIETIDLNQNLIVHIQNFLIYQYNFVYNAHYRLV